MADSTDVLVVGGGPAGLAAAIAVRQQGFRVIVADGDRPPIDKACGEALMPDAIRAFEALGLSAPATEASLLTGVRFLSSGLSAEATFPAACGLSVRRTTLHRIMAERAAALGADLRWQTAVTGIHGQEVQVGKRRIHSRWIIGADGVNSRVRSWTNLQSYFQHRLRYAFRRHYHVPLWTDRMEIYWGRRHQAYMCPVNKGEVCIAVASREPNGRLDEALRGFPELAVRLDGAEIASVERGAIVANRKFKRIWRDHVALIGDASGTVDPITGEGLGLAFRQAVILAECLKENDLARYQAEHRKLALRPTMMARLMLTLDGRPGLQMRTLQAFCKRPEIFRRLLALHVGELSPFDVAVGGLMLGWGLLAA
jgi:menaquinone-9 beta-reductase